VHLNLIFDSLYLWFNLETVPLNLTPFFFGVWFKLLLGAIFWLVPREFWTVTIGAVFESDGSIYFEQNLALFWCSSAEFWCKNLSGSRFLNKKTELQNCWVWCLFWFVICVVEIELWKLVNWGEYWGCQWCGELIVQIGRDLEHKRKRHSAGT